MFSPFLFNMKYIFGEVKLVYKTKEHIEDRLTNSEEVHSFFRKYYEDVELKESVWLLGLSQYNIPKFIMQISSGGISSTTCDPRLIFKPLLDSASTCFIVAHNHPSGNEHISTADREITTKLKQAGELFDIRLLDHLILLPNNKYVSFADTRQL